MNRPRPLRRLWWELGIIAEKARRVSRPVVAVYRRSRRRVLGSAATVAVDDYEGGYDAVVFPVIGALFTISLAVSAAAGYTIGGFVGAVSVSVFGTLTVVTGYLTFVYAIASVYFTRE